jgi:hypothetical protein
MPGLDLIAPPVAMRGPFAAESKPFAGGVINNRSVNQIGFHDRREAAQ